MKPHQQLLENVGAVEDALGWLRAAGPLMPQPQVLRDASRHLGLVSAQLEALARRQELETQAPRPVRDGRLAAANDRID